METEEKAKDFGVQVLIVPLWNWNNASPIMIKINFSSNRTFMELKFGKGRQIVPSCSRSNRTFMELKSDICWYIAMTAKRSNRTFMELKLVRISYHCRRQLSSNRTFMELKYVVWEFNLILRVF